MDIYRLLTTVLLYELSTIMKAFGETRVDWLSDSAYNDLCEWHATLLRHTQDGTASECEQYWKYARLWLAYLQNGPLNYYWAKHCSDEAEWRMRGDQNTDCLFSSCYSSMLCQTRRWNSPVITVLEILFYISFLTCMLYKFDEIKIFKTDRLSFYLSQDDSVLPQFVSWSISLSISIKTKRSMSF